VTTTEQVSRGPGAGESLVARVLAALYRPVDVAWLVAFRVLFGGMLGISMQRFLAYGWVDELLLAPRFRFKYWGFGWVEPLAPPLMHLLFWVLFVFGIFVAAGFLFRIAATAFALGFTYVQLIDVSTYLNHYYLASLLAWLLALSPAGRAYSVDAWLRGFWARRRSSTPLPPEREISAAWHVLFRVQIGIVYTFAGLAKAQSDWLLHGQPLRIWLGANTELPILGELFTIEAVPLLMSWFGFLFDTTIVWWLLYRKTRPWAYLVVIVFHVMTKLLFNIGMFPFIMMFSALVFFSPSWPRVVWARLKALFGGGVGAAASSRLGRSLEEAAGQSSTLATSSRAAPLRLHRSQKFGAVLGISYCIIQALLPFRHWLYGDNVLWHEQGMRFSWRVMVRVKGGGTTFLVHDPKAGRTWHVSPREYLTPMQEAEMSSQPDLILQLAHHIRDEYEARCLGPVEVRAESYVTLNGRRSALMLDPGVDLAAVRDGLGRADWILPAPTVPPPHTRPVL
jgi:vitamin K-dependent gamma-carboxylase